MLRSPALGCFASLAVACASPESSQTDLSATTGTSGGSSESGAPTTSEANASTGDLGANPRLNHLQALGTHNSYHVSPGSLVTQWDYTHRPLDEQLESQGVRKFELDLFFRGAGEPIDVYHIETLDTGSTCPTFVECLQTIKGWSDAHPGHHPLYVMIELKTAFVAQDAGGLLQTLEDQLASVWPRERLIVPDDVQGEAANLREGLAASGWPELDAVRGRALFVLHDDGKWRETYTEGGTSTAGRLLFPDAFGAIDLPFAAVHSINDPIGDVAQIHAAVDAGHLVRTRSDADNVEPAAGDTTRATAALASGAHFISTDYPPPKGEKYDFVVEIPGGTPSRCNPRSAPPGCTPAAIEDPAALAGP